jgi:hypothetical protein
MKLNVMNWAAVAAILLGCCSCSSTPNPSDWNKLGWWHRVATDPPTYVPTGYAAIRPRTAQDGRWFIDRRDGKRVFQGLEIPYRVIDVATGDLGAPAYRKFDIEAWMPGRGESGEYGEISSASNCTDFQARRLRARFRRADGRRNELLHTLNGTAIAVTRTLIPLLENHQRADGSIAIPKALQPYFGRESIGPR